MNIIIVEDSELISHQLIRLIATQPRIRICGVAASEEEAVQMILDCQPDAVLLDLALSPGSGVRVLERIRQAGCAARVMVLSNNTDAALRVACIEQGISGFFDKSADAHRCLEKLFGWLPELPRNEAARLRALQSVHLLDAPEQETFDNLPRLAKELTDPPMALISLIDKDRQWFLSHAGLATRQTSRSIAFCAHAILCSELMEVPDALSDPRFNDNPLVIGAPHIRYYAGVPLVLPSGEAIGTLCILDTVTRQLSERQKRALATLAQSALSEIELRRRVITLEEEIKRRQHAEAHVHHLATRDPLTGLANRVTLNDRLEQQIRQSSRQQNPVGVLLIDVDRFKQINDTLGHAVGDDALQTIGQRLSGNLRASDTVARLGGDEFAVILPELADADEATLVANKLLQALNEPTRSSEHRLRIDASIGVAVFPEHGDGADQLLRHAGLAMVEAKQRGGGRISVFSQRLDDHAEATAALASDLRQALDRDELTLHYQPQANLAGDRLCGVEALVRWQHPHLGIIGPDRFIPMAETRGFIQEIGRQVLDRALAQLAAWDRAQVPVGRISVNISAHELRPCFVDSVEAALARHGLTPDRLELEITESALTSDGVETLTLLARLRSLGISIAIDDFGVGYSSLGQLHRLPIDCLKIDKCFVHDVDSSDADAAIVSAVVTMAGALGMHTIVEGVETEAQRQKLSELGCDCVQGYLLSRPLPADAVPLWVDNFVNHQAVATAA